MKIEAYMNMMSDLRAENENLRERVNKQFDKLQVLTKENEDLKNQLLRLQKTSADSKEIQASFMELKKENAQLKEKYNHIKSCYNNLVNTTAVRLKAEDFYILYNVKNNKYYLFLNFENKIQTQIEITKDFYLKLHKGFN